MKQKVLLIGGFHKTYSLAKSLLGRKYDVVVINKDYETCLTMAELKSLKVIQGDGTKPYVLEEAGADSSSIVIALTQHDQDNLVICELAKKQFQVKKTVALLEDSRKTDFFYKMGVDSVVCATNIVSGIIEQQAFIDDMMALIPIGNGKVHISEIQIQNGVAAIGKKIWEMNLPDEVIICCILRQTQNIIPRGDTRILEGDILVLISDEKHEAEAIHCLISR